MEAKTYYLNLSDKGLVDGNRESKRQIPITVLRNFLSYIGRVNFNKTETKE